MTNTVTGKVGACDQVVKRLQNIYGSWTRETTVEQMREDWDRFYADAAYGPNGNAIDEVRTQDLDINGLPCRWVIGKGVSEKPETPRSNAILYLHGGGFRMGSIDSHQDLMARISQTAQSPVLGVNYRLCPEYEFPAALDDSYRAYSWLLNNGFNAQSIAIVGDSAGANLVAALLNKLLINNEPSPSAAVLLSPWLDMTAAHETYETRAEFDPIHQRKFITALGAGYLGETGDPKSPLTSPIEGDLRGLPPMLIQVGDWEVGLGDSLDYAEKAKAAGVEVELEVWDEMIHVFQLFADELPEAQKAIENIGQFLIGKFNG